MSPNHVGPLGGRHHKRNGERCATARRRRRKSFRQMILRVPRNGDRLVAMLDELTATIPRVRDNEAAMQFFAAVSEALKCGVMLTPKRDTRATRRTGNCVYTFEPSNTFKRAVAAARAGNWDKSFIDKVIRHRGAPALAKYKLTTRRAKRSRRNRGISSQAEGR